MFEEKRAVLEPAGALAIAGAEAYCKYYGLKGENVVAITSGANINFDGLRLVSELTDGGRRHESVLATIVPEKFKKFKEFCPLVCQQNTFSMCSKPILFLAFLPLDFLKLRPSFCFL
jgi:threonine dehydratase